MTSVRFPGKPFNITVIQVYAATTNAKEAKVEQFTLKMNQDHPVFFEVVSKDCILDFLLTVSATPFLLRDFFSQ